MGGIEPRKNTARTLEAFAQLRGRHPHARLWILGGATVLDHGAYRAAFGRTLLELSPATQDAVVELGVVADDDVPALFHLANVLALPSLHEGFGLAALEALASGLPVVASNTPPFTEFLDASCAELVDPDSVDAITDGLSRALKSSSERTHAGRERARAHAWSRVAAAHITHYERIIADAGDALRRSLA